MKNRKKIIIKQALLKIHQLFIKFGVFILPVHYYSPVPNIIELRQDKNIWVKKSEMPGLSVNLDEQVHNLRNICLPYREEYIGNKFYREAISIMGEEYGYIEAQALHAIIRYFKPRNIIEVGSGVSTYCNLAALKINQEETGIDGSISCIEPYPSNSLKKLPDVELLTKKVQDVPLKLFNKLKQNDLLFIDSSHTVKPGGDVNYIILEILPRLQKGVIVHFHDIYFPYDYQRDVLQTYYHWTETSLLRAFLIFNEKAGIIFCMSNLHYERQDALVELFPEYRPQQDINGLVDGIYEPFVPKVNHFPSSIYFKIK